jgi:hypothetical protein
MSEDGRRELPPVSRPRAALALFRQRTRCVAPPLPSGFEARTHQRARHTLAPDAAVAGQAFAELHAGFLSLRVPHVATEADGVDALAANEEAELRARSAKDGAAAPRRVAVTLLLSGVQHEHSLGWLLLDAAAVLTAHAGTEVRVTVLADADAAHVYGKLCMRAPDDSLEQHRLGVAVLVRWARGAVEDSGEEPSIGLESASLPDGAAGGGNAVHVAAVLQRHALCTLATHGCDVPPLLSTVPKALAEPGAAFDVSWAKHSGAFCAFAIGDPSVTRECDPSVPLRPLRFAHEYVRLCPRESKIDDENSMHALVLCAEAKTTEARSYLTLHQDGVRPARSEGEHALELHLLGVTVRRLELNGAVSLFAGRGTPGESVSAPNSWMVQLQPVVWPLSDHLCRRFFVVPCAPSSWRPLEQGLAPFCAQEAELAAKLYSAQFVVDGHMARSVEDTEALKPLREQLAEALALRRRALPPQEAAIAAALGLPLLGSRATVGDAYAQAATAAPNSGLSQLLLRSAVQLGSGVGLNRAFEVAANALKRPRSAEAAEAEHTRTSRLRALLSELDGVSADVPPPNAPPNAPPQVASDAVELGTEPRVPGGGALCFVRRVIAGMALQPVPMGGADVLKLKASLEQRDVTELATHAAALLGVERKVLKRARKKELAVHVAEGLKRAKLAGACEAALAFLNADALELGAFLFFYGTDDLLYAHRFEGRRAIPTAPEAILHASRPLLLTAVQKASGAHHIRAWRADA